MKIRHLIASVVASGLCATLWAQADAPVQFGTNVRNVNDSTLEIEFAGRIEPKWHVYSSAMDEGGPTRAAFKVDAMSGCRLDGELEARGREISVYEDIFEMQVRYFEDEVTFAQRVVLTGGDYRLDGYLQYGACSGGACTPPTSVNVRLSGAGPAVAAQGAVPQLVPVGVQSVGAPAAVASPYSGPLWEPAADGAQTMAADARTKSWFYIFLMGLVGGFLALFTPCVWPIIPMTVSFFLKRSSTRSRGIRDAFVYGASIVVTYLTLGIGVTLIFGSNGLNAMATNAVFNIFFFLMLVVFAASFMGAFEITLPSSWSNAVDSKSLSTSGFVSIYLMAFTLSLVSFSCTGPIVGFLLVEVSTSGSYAAPIIGMAGFALALALPFTLFAIFPSWLRQMPKSGGWMNVIKVTLGFVELAFALKFLSVADLAYGWRLLDRETFLALWIALALLLALYLLGKIRFPHDSDDTRIGVPRFFMALLSLAFAIYLVPGLWGASLKAVSAFAPPMSTQDFDLNTAEVHAHFTDYEQGMAYAAQHGKPALIDFTGHGCVNCRQMEQAVWTDARVARLLTDDYVLVSLYVDDKTPLPERVEFDDNGTAIVLRTVGDKWSYLQQRRFGVAAQPYYVVLDAAGRMIAEPYVFDTDPDKFVDFLQRGKEAFSRISQ